MKKYDKNMKTNMKKSILLHSSIAGISKVWIANHPQI